MTREAVYHPLPDTLTKVLENPGGARYEAAVATDTVQDSRGTRDVTYVYNRTTLTVVDPLAGVQIMSWRAMNNDLETRLARLSWRAKPIRAV